MSRRAVGFVAVLYLSVLPSIRADEATLARLRKEYPEAGLHVESVYSHIRSEMSRKHSKNGVFEHGHRVIFYRDGDRFRFEHELTTADSSHVAGHLDTTLANDALLIEATRPGPDA